MYNFLLTYIIFYGKELNLRLFDEVPCLISNTLCQAYFLIEKYIERNIYGFSSSNP